MNIFLYIYKKKKKKKKKIKKKELILFVQFEHNNILNSNVK